MPQLTAATIFGAVRGLFSSLDATDDVLLKNLLTREKVEVHVTDGGTAATAQTETFAWKNTTGASMLLVSSSFCTPVAVTANDTNFATFTVTKRSSVGGSAAVAATMPTTITAGSGNVTAFVPAAMTLTVANVVVAPNEVLTVLVSKAAAGVAIAAATSQARVELVLEPI